MTPVLAHYPCPVCGASAAETVYTVNDFRIVKCPPCGMVYVNPRIRSEEIVSIYQDGYFTRGSESGYENYELTAPLRIKTFERWYADCRPYLPDARSSALDIGCAAGYFLDLLKRNGWRHAEGIELDKKMLPALRGRGHPVSDAPIEQFTSGRRYHLITLFDVLEHLPDINGDFDKITSMLEPEGIIVLVTPDFNSAQRRLFGKRWFQFKPREHIYYFSDQTLRLMAGKHGLTIAHCAPAGQYADYEFLHNRLAKYRFPLIEKCFSAACTLFNARKKFWYVDTGSLFAVLKKATN